MAITKFSANFKLREDLIDSITPLAKVSDDTDRSVGAPRPAAWLPIQFTKTNRDQGTDAYVISAFKVVSLDTEGRVVPAGLRTALGGNASTSVYAGTVLSYTATDADYGVTSLVTGLPVTGAVSYTGKQVCDGLIERGLVRDDDAIAAGATIPVAADADVNIVIDMFISHPIGMLLMDAYVWSGLPEEGNQVFTNYSKQHAVTYMMRGMFRVPHRVAGSTTSDDFDVATLDAGGTTTYTTGAFIDDGEYWTADEFTDINRYSAVSATAPVIALGLSERWVARNTDRTPFTCDTDGVLVRERTSVDAVAKEGDWYLDSEVGVLFLHEDTWATQLAAAATITFSYNFYTDTGVATYHRYIHFDGPCRPGDWVTYDSKSNLTVASSTVVSAGLALGRVHKIIREPLDLLQNVKTGWNLSGVSAAMKMPGSATKGFSDLITLSGETVADQLVEVSIDI